MAHAEAVGGKIFTRPVRFLIAFLGLWALFLAWRFAAGLGPVSGLTDGYPWGIWIAFDVVTGTALACGGYAIAILAYILNRGQYHPLVRPALLTSALGYSLAGLAIAIDVGRPWFIHRIPLRVGQWNLNSALLEVALCVMAYVIVLWIELAPAFLEKLRDSGSGGLARLAGSVNAVLDKLLVFVIALGLLLPTMHQSSLGTVMLIAGHKLHPLWSTGLLPLLFLVSCVGMGYAVVVFEAGVSSAVFKRRRETTMLGSLSGVMVVVLALFLALRLLDIVIAGELGMLFTEGLLSLVFWVELALFAVPMVILASPSRRQRYSQLLSAATLMLLGGAMYRFDTYIVAYDPGPGWSYFPTLPELIITFGVVALEIVLYVVIVKLFPILSGGAAAESAQ